MTQNIFILFCVARHFANLPKFMVDSIHQTICATNLSQTFKFPDFFSCIDARNYVDVCTKVEQLIT